jgi:hypothetical protein
LLSGGNGEWLRRRGGEGDKERQDGVPFGFSKPPASRNAAVASRGREVRTTEAVIVRGRSASCSSSGIGAAEGGEERMGRLVFDIVKAGRIE